MSQHLLYSNKLMCAGISENIKPGKTVGVELCGEKLVLYRGKNGQVSCNLVQHISLLHCFENA